MKLRLVVQTEGNNKGKVLDISLAEFVIGRDPQCHLRPASPLISKRHCQISRRDGKVFLQDFGSTNGTLVDDQPVKGEIELTDGNVLKIGPLIFAVKIEAEVIVNRPTPAPVAKAPATAAASVAAKAPVAKPKRSGADDDEIAALLLGDETDTGGGGIIEERVPEGSTVMDLAAMRAKEEALSKEAQTKAEEAAKAEEKKKGGSAGDTRSAAESILKKYMKRPRK